MKKIILFFAAVLFTASSYAQVHKAVNDRILQEYKEDYTLVSIDTVTMPIRTVLSLNYVMTTNLIEADRRLNAMQGLPPDLQAISLKKLAETMEQNLDEILKIEDIIAMRNAAPEGYHDYQRTVVYLQQSKREETFYIRLGEESATTRVEYNNMEAEAFLRYRQYYNLYKKIKDILEM